MTASSTSIGTRGSLPTLGVLSKVLRLTPSDACIVQGYVQLLVPSLRSHHVCSQKASAELIQKLSSGHEHSGIEKALLLLQEKCVSARHGGIRLLACMLALCRNDQRYVCPKLLRSSALALVAGIRSADTFQRRTAAACAPSLSALMSASVVP